VCRDKKSDEERFVEVVVTSMVLSLLLIIISALHYKSSSFGGKYKPDMCDYKVTFFLVALVSSFQIYLFNIIKDHPVNNNILTILHILLLSSLTSIVQLSFVSPVAALVIIFSWIHLFERILLVSDNKSDM
jgi:hypothetical protein